MAGELVANGNYRIHTIKRDNNEKYVVVYGAGVLRVFDLAGNEATVGITADAQAYLDANDASADELRLVTVADYTLLLNTTVPVTASDSADYVVTKTHRDYDVMLSHTPANDTYHKTREATATQVKGYYKYHLDTGSFPTWHRNSATFNIAYFQNAARNPGGFKVGMSRFAATTLAAEWEEGPKRLTAPAAIFTDYTFAAGDQVYISNGTNITPGWYNIASKESSTALILEDSPATGATSNNIRIRGIGHQYEVIVNLLTETLNDHYDVALKFQDALQSAGCTDGLIEWVETAVDKGYFVITGKWRGAGTQVFAPTAPDSGYNYTQSGTPFRNSAATSVAGTGTYTDAADQIEPVADRWTKVPPPGDPDAILDATTLPVKMVRTAIGPPATFSVALIDWADRLSGDFATNPVMSIWEKGYAISDITFHRDRFWIMGGEKICASQAGDYFNFYIEDAENIGDSDPIDIALSSEKVTIGDFIVPFRKTLLIMSEAGSQFELNAPEALTPDTAAITATTMYNTLPVRPETIGLKVYFPAKNASGTQLLEYYFTDSAAAADAIDVSQHVIGYLPTSVRTLRCSANDNAVLILPEAVADLSDPCATTLPPTTLPDTTLPDTTQPGTGATTLPPTTLPDTTVATTPAPTTLPDTTPPPTTPPPTTAVATTLIETTLPPPENACNSCSPAIPDTLYVTLAGLAGDLAQFNGKHTLTWVAGCLWGELATTWSLTYLGSNQWLVTGGTATGCEKSWIITTGPCTPQGTYGENTCDDSTCTNHDSCENSAGATCSVSLT